MSPLRGFLDLLLGKRQKDRINESTNPSQLRHLLGVIILAFIFD
jgi:hypothetical protein